MQIVLWAGFFVMLKQNIDSRDEKNKSINNPVERSHHDFTIKPYKNFRSHMEAKDSKNPMKATIYSSH